MFKNKDVASGILFVAVSLIFGISAFLNYPISSLWSPGPGLIPLIFSSVLFLVGTGVLVKGLSLPAEAIIFRFKNLSIVMVSILAFVLATKFVNMILGLVALIYIATLALPEYSVKRNAKIVVGLAAIAAIFKYGFGVDLPLI